MNELLRGIADVLDAFRFLLARPRLWRYVIAPFLVAVVLAVLIVWWIAGHIDPLVVWATDWLPSLLESVAGPLMRVLFWLIFGAAGFVAYLALVAVLTSPFCEMLSEEVEEEMTGRESPAFSLSTFLRDLALGLGHALRRVLVFLAAWLGLLLLGTVIPVVGTVIALVIGAVITARFAAYDCFDTVWARKGWSYQQKLDYLGSNRYRSLGIGAGVSGLALVPIVSALALPLGSIAATRVAFGSGSSATS